VKITDSIPSRFACPSRSRSDLAGRRPRDCRDASSFGFFWGVGRVHRTRDRPGSSETQSWAPACASAEVPEPRSAPSQGTTSSRDRRTPRRSTSPGILRTLNEAISTRSTTSRRRPSPSAVRRHLREAGAAVHKLLGRRVPGPVAVRRSLAMKPTVAETPWNPSAHGVSTTVASGISGLKNRRLPAPDLANVVRGSGTFRDRIVLRFERQRSAPRTLRAHLLLKL